MGSQTPTILAIDDIKDNLISLQAILFDAFPGARIISAQSGAKGLELAYSEDPDVILLDIVMPGMDGFEVCRRLKADPRLQHIPVVFLTARQTDRQSRIKALESGGEAFLSKPLEEAELIAQIRAMHKIKLAAVAQRRENELLAAMVDERTRELNRELGEHRRAEEALRESEERYRTLLESVPAIIYRYSTVRGGLFYSPQVEGVFGHPLSVFYEQPMLWRDSIHPDDINAVMRSLAAFAHDDCSGFDIEYRIRSKSGEWLWLNDRSISKVAHGVELVIDGIAQDITGRKREERERFELERQLQQAQRLESLGVLAGGIAHDFNNILTIIQGHCYLATLDSSPDVSVKPHIHRIEDAAGRAAQLCRQMLVYAGNAKLVQTRFSLRPLVADMLKMLHAALPKNVVIHFDSDGNQAEIIGDLAQIQQIVMNLVINASDAIGDNQGNIRISLTPQNLDTATPMLDFFGKPIPGGLYTCLEVADDGCGMDEATQHRIFEPFFTTKFTGRGLGMSAIIGIIKSHRGALTLTSVPDSGTTFRIYFPPHASAPVNDQEVRQPLPQSNISAPAATVLLAEDEEEQRFMCSALLGLFGFKCIPAANGREAMEIFRKREREIDLVMLDMIMPEMGGLETFRELRKRSPRIPVVFCSGFAHERFSESMEHDPAVARICKPYDPAQLRDMLRNMVAPRYSRPMNLTSG